MGRYYEAEAVRAAARGQWESILERLGADRSLLTNRHSPCPACGGKDRFRFDDKEGNGSFLCSQGGDLLSGDGVALVMHLRGCEWKEALQLVGDLLGIEGREMKPREDGVARQPEKERKKVGEMFDPGALRKLVAGVPEADPEYFIERSPIDPRRVLPGEFLTTVFEPGERALVFTNFYSQGDFAWEVGRGGFRLGGEPGVQAVKSALPLDGGRDGVWWLSNPVSLQWMPNPRKEGEKSRRTKECVTAWRYLVLESDIAKEMRKEGRIEEAIEMESMWLRFLAAFPDPIRAIYSSGGGSWHALVAVERSSWAAMDGLLKGNPRGKRASERMGVKALWAKFGADPGALTPVRLTRLPGCLRNRREQRLIYLNPGPGAMFEEPGGVRSKRIMDLVRRREVARG